MRFDKTNTAILVFLFSVLNLVVYFYRDKFAYHKFATASSLTSPHFGKWRKFVDDLPREHFAEANDILDSLHVDDSTEISKILSIGGMLYGRFHNQTGSPSPQLESKLPLDQFKILSSSDTVHLWCGHFAFMFAFFCWSKGIPCRVVEIMNPGDHHVLNECYLPEVKKWVATDVTNNNLLFLDQDTGVYLDLAGLRSPSKTMISVLQARDTVVERNLMNIDFYKRYFGDKNPIHYYYRVDPRQVYKTNEKIKRYFFPVSWYEEFNSPTSTNLPFYVKQLLILCLLISLVLFLKKTFLGS